MKHTVLVVDDENDNVEALERLFRNKYHVLKATSGQAALELLKSNAVSLIVSDQRMPGMTGVEFLEKSISSNPEAVRILLTGYTDVESVIAAINSGQIYRYVTKPWDPVELQITVDRAIERFELRHELKNKNEELEMALNELRTLDEAKSRFIILINHELKTPLTSLLNFLGLVKESKLSADQKLYLERIEQSADRLKEIVFDVVEFVSAETGNTKLSARAHKLEPIVNRVLKSLDEDIKKKSQKIILQLIQEPVVCDEKQLESVLRRLLHNASKFSKDSSEIRIRQTKVKTGHRIAIENEGKPLSNKTIEKILKPFTLDEDIMNHSKGIGLGLSISQAILRLHGSHLEFESEGGLVTVSFTLEG